MNYFLIYIYIYILAGSIQEYKTHTPLEYQHIEPDNDAMCLVVHALVSQSTYSPNHCKDMLLSQNTWQCLQTRPKPAKQDSSSMVQTTKKQRRKSKPYFGRQKHKEGHNHKLPRKTAQIMRVLAELG